MTKFRVIITDDIFTNRLLLSEILEDLGCEFFMAKNGKEAVDELKDNEYDLVLMDIEMPVMNGVEATRFIRNELPSPKNEITIVALTAHNPKLFFNDFKDVGFNQLITKPYSIVKIRNVIDGLVVKSTE